MQVPRIETSRLLQLATQALSDGKTEAHTVDPESFSDFVGGYLSDLWSNPAYMEHVKGVWLQSWTCTDTVVGVRLILIENTPVALWRQSARKSTGMLSWLNQAVMLHSIDWLNRRMLEQQAPAVCDDLGTVCLFRNHSQFIAPWLKESCTDANL